MDCSTLGRLVHSQILENTQTHVDQVSDDINQVRDVIQPSHPLSSLSSPSFNRAQHRGLFQWVSFLHQVARVLELQHQSFQWIFRVDFLWYWLVWSCSPRESQEYSPTPQFRSISSLVLSLMYGLSVTFIHDYWKNHSFDYTDFCWQRVISAL